MPPIEGEFHEQEEQQQRIPRIAKCVDPVRIEPIVHGQKGRRQHHRERHLCQSQTETCSSILHIMIGVVPFEMAVEEFHEHQQPENGQGVDHLHDRTSIEGIAVMGNSIVGQNMLDKVTTRLLPHLAHHICGTQFSPNFSMLDLTES